MMVPALGLHWRSAQPARRAHSRLVAVRQWRNYASDSGGEHVHSVPTRAPQQWRSSFARAATSVVARIRFRVSGASQQTTTRTTKLSSTRHSELGYHYYYYYIQAWFATFFCITSISKLGFGHSSVFRSLVRVKKIGKFRPFWR